MKKILEIFYFHLVYCLLHLLFLTYRIRSIGHKNRKICGSRHQKGAYILACWHEHFIPITVAQKGYPFCPIVSRSSTGRLIGYTMKRYGFFPIYGSQNRHGVNKGGKEAREQLKERLALGQPSAFTVDGSIGPRRYVKPGVIDLARRSGAAILPTAATADRYWKLNTWDSLKIPKPFSRIIISYGDALLVPDEAECDYKSYQDKLAQALNTQEESTKAQLLLWNDEPFWSKHVFPLYSQD